jgi:glycosyltransferase involved in cell wall biosynthesis
MKILRIIARLNVGGPARHVIWLTKELQDNEFCSVLIAGTIPDGEADMTYFAEQNGVRPVYIEEMSRELSVKDAVALYRVYRRMKLENPDIIHTHTAKAGTVGRFAALIYRWLTWRTLIGRPRDVKIVHTFHGHVFHSYYGPLKTRVFLTIEKVLARIATNKIVVLSGRQLREINERFGIGKASQFKVIPLGIDLESFLDIDAKRKGFRDQIGAGADEIVVGLVGRLTEIKNISLFLKAASVYAQTDQDGEPKLKFVIVGDGHLRKRLESESEALGLGDIVTFLGHRPEISDLYFGMDIIALTSLNEGTPLSLIEAMAAGKPVISTAVGGVADLLGETEDILDDFQICQRGITFESGSAQSLYKGLIYLAKNEKLRERLGSEGRQFVTARYSKTRLAEDVRELYRDLVTQ